MVGSSRRRSLVSVSGARRLSTLACEVGLGAPLVLAGRPLAADPVRRLTPP